MEVRQFFYSIVQLNIKIKLFFIEENSKITQNIKI